MKKVAIDPATVLHPHPVLLVGSFGLDGKPNLMNAAWGGICCSEPPCIAISLREATLTYHNILHNRAFSVGIPSKKQVEIADYLAVVSLTRPNKVQPRKSLSPLNKTCVCY